MPFIGWNIGEEIHAERKFQVAGVEIYQVIGPGRRNAVQKVFGKVAMGVNQTDPMAHGNVLNEHISQQGCLARTCLADDVDMVAMVGR